VARTVRLVVDEVQGVDGFVDTANFGDGLCQAGGSLIDLQGAHDTHRRYQTELERVDQAQYVVPIWCDALEVHALSRQSVEGAIVGVGVNPPEACTADIGQASSSV